MLDCPVIIVDSVPVVESINWVDVAAKVDIDSLDRVTTLVNCDAVTENPSVLPESEMALLVETNVGVESGSVAVD